MSITAEEKRPFYNCLKLYEQYRFNKLSKYRRKNVEDLIKIIDNCDSDLDLLEQEIIYYSNMHIKSGMILFGYCLFSFGNSALKNNLMSIMSIEKIKRENKRLEVKLRESNEENSQLKEQNKNLLSECDYFKSEVGEQQLCVAQLKKEKNKLYSRVLELMDELKKFINKDENIDEKAIFPLSHK